MKKSYNDIKALKSDLKKDINAVLADEVFNEVRKCELEHLEEDVFSIYEPSIYERRRTGGLDDENNIIAQVNDGTLTVLNITQFNPGYGTSNKGVGLAELVNGGDGAGGYQYDYPFRIRVPYTEPRKFIDNTITELENTSKLNDALVKGLRKRGIDAN